MPYVMTQPDDVVEVVFEAEEGSFSIKVGTIPESVGAKIAECEAKAVGVALAQISGENIEKAVLQNIEAKREEARLLFKYGIRGHSGLYDSDQNPIPCDIEKEEGTGHTILSEKTLNIYMSNPAFLTLLSDRIVLIRKLGIAQYKVGGEQALKKAEDEQKRQEAAVSAPLLTSLLGRSNTSTPSATTNETG